MHRSRKRFRYMRMPAPCAILLTSAAILAAATVAPTYGSPTPMPHATTAGGSHQISALEGCMNQWLFNGVWRVRVTKLEPVTRDITNVPGYGVTIEVRNGSHATTSMAYSGVSGSGTLALNDGSTLQQDTDEEIAWHQDFYKDLLPGAGFHFMLKFYLSAKTDNPPKAQKWILAIDPTKEGTQA